MASKTLMDSLMETMYQLGSSPSEIAAAIESLSPTPPAEPVAARAFPDYYYERKPVISNLTYFIPQPSNEERMRYLNYKPSKQCWGQWCQCGHVWEHHAPACIHLIEGCDCEEFHPANAVAEGA